MVNLHALVAQNAVETRIKLAQIMQGTGQARCCAKAQRRTTLSGKLGSVFQMVRQKLPIAVILTISGMGVEQLCMLPWVTKLSGLPARHVQFDSLARRRSLKLAFAINQKQDISVKDSEHRGYGFSVKAFSNVMRRKIGSGIR